jgi:hypothetical protein
MFRNPLTNRVFVFVYMTFELRYLSQDAFSSEAWVNVVKWNEHFTESAIF